MSLFQVAAAAVPNIGIHLLLADRVLGHWAESAAEPPFDVRLPRLRAAFLYGTLTPDAGYYPRSDRLFSELAHLTRTGQLVRALVGEARAAPERAHAWGWLVHVLGDLAIHPLINQAHGEQVYGERRPITSTEDELGHMRIEYGLDVAVFRAFPEIRRIGLPWISAGECFAHVRRAYRRIFGWEPPPQLGQQAHSVAWRATKLARFVNGVHSARTGERPLHALLRFTSRALAPPRPWLPSAWNRSNTMRAGFSPIPVPAWLVEEVSEVVRRVGDRIEELRASRLESLADHDLVTGSQEVPASPTPRAAQALRQLATRKQLSASTSLAGAG